MPHNRSVVRRPRGYATRNVETRDPRQRFLIICEGEQTEPNYFKSFRVPKSVASIDILGKGFNPSRLVEFAVERRVQDGPYDQVWCVFDRDDFLPQDFNSALALAKQEGFQVAYSNEAFELWYLLHFHYYQTGITRRDYISKLTALLGYPYKKNSSTIYRSLEAKQIDAIRNARQLMDQYDPRRPALDNPSTTVHLLVEELNKFLP